MCVFGGGRRVEDGLKIILVGAPGSFLFTCTAACLFWCHRQLRSVATVWPGVHPLTLLLTFPRPAAVGDHHHTAAEHARATHPLPVLQPA